MTFLANHISTINRLVVMCGAPILVAATLFAGTAVGSEHRLSDKYALEVDPAAKEKLGEQTFDELMVFFHAAEKAIETKDIEALMALYSDNYSNGEHDKKSARLIWQKIFATFDTMAMHHNMKLGKVTTDKNMVVFQCNGLLLGVPDTKKTPITIDNWNNQEHVLAKEAGQWKLIGTYGLERKRLWFDKPMHPLF